ncbi:MAG: ABC-type lipoprotein release transport system permease subunit [Candidatus Paceibacteria bacterium]|jgi:ABC-type lipoprotein release transport system permease subunit
MYRLKSSIRVGLLLGKRQLFNSSKWVTSLIILILTLTFLSNVLISGILVGLIQGSTDANRRQYTGSIFISELADELYIENTTGISDTLSRLDEVDSFSKRYIAGASVEANYQTRRDFNNLPNTVGVSLAGINPVDEDNVTDLSRSVIEGKYLDENESGYIIIGATLLKRYSAFSDQFEPLKDVFIGDKIKISINGGSSNGIDGTQQNSVDENSTLSGSQSNGRVQEFTVKGIIDTKVGQVSTRAFITESDFRRLTGRKTLEANEISAVLKDGESEENVKNILLLNGFGDIAKIETSEEAIPKFLDDIKQTFTILGLLIGLIISAVGAITIFIVIYINAIVKRKQIGILKGIGISKFSIVLSYIYLATIYAVVGVSLALALIYGLLVPFVEKNPIDFPFSDGIIAANLGLVSARLIVVLVASFFAGMIPAWIITRQNTLDSILGR